jgi:c-di-GMP-binding flagellar brake protein YcgR
MMSTAERRRHVRVTLPVGEAVQIEVRHRVRLLDISQSGALLVCDASLPVGSLGKVRAALSAAPFTADVEVRRQQPAAGSRQTQAALGTMFLTMDEISRRSLEQFLRRASE